MIPQIINNLLKYSFIRFQSVYQQLIFERKQEIHAFDTILLNG